MERYNTERGRKIHREDKFAESFHPGYAQKPQKMNGNRVNLSFVGN